MIITDGTFYAQLLRRKYRNNKIVFVSGNFNIIHPGHLRLLNFARTCGDKLVVALFSDTEPGVVVPLSLRAESVRGLAAVDEVINITHDELSKVLILLKPHAVVKGKEHESGENTEREAVRSYGGHLIFSSGDAKFSSLDLIRKEVFSSSEYILRQDVGFLLRHNTSKIRLREIVNSYQNLNVLVIGDLIVDEYIHCEPLGMSQEDPTIVVTPVDSNTFIGGAGIVAGHVSGLGARSTFVSTVGDDSVAAESKRFLEKYGVGSALFSDPSRPTTLKQRFRASNKTLLRVSHLRTHDIEEDLVHKILSKIRDLLPSTNLVIFSDFNYGCLPQSLVDSIIQLCISENIPFAADSQASSQVGNVARFRYSDVLAATEREVRLAVNDFKSGLQNVANRLLDNSGAKILLVKLGAEGLIIITSDSDYRTDSIKALNPNPVDVAGAGDALLATAALALACGATAWEAAYLGSVAAGIQVSRIGNVPIDHKSLVRELSIQ